MHRQRIDWIDTLKGIGIVLVVIGHSTSGTIYDLIYLFHMPLFFIIAGMVFRPTPMAAYILRRARTLLVPYAVFLVALSLLEALLDVRSGKALPQIATDLAASFPQDLYGGRALTGDFGAFWFVPTLFLALCAYNLLRNWLGQPDSPRMTAAMLAIFLAAYPLGPLNTPWNLSVDAMALVFIWVGDLWSTFFQLRPDDRPEYPHPNGTVFRPEVPAILAVAISTAAAGLLLAEPFDMKFGNYGTPLLSVLNAVAITHLLATACRALCRHPAFTRVFVPLGQASLVILFVHRFFVLHLLDRLPVPAVVTIALAIPFLVWLVLRRAATLPRFLFLGDALSHRATLLD